jgi:tRNA(Arg) A34 adenosine deaminase TadA
MTDHEAMRAAIDVCRKGMEADQDPFGAVIVRDGRVLAACYNTVRKDLDPTAHAEINALRQAAREAGSTSLGGSVLYSTCEPCPMCASAIWWAGIDRVVFGAAIADALSVGFSQLQIPAAEVGRIGGHTRFEHGPLREECAALLREGAP